jgi:hypothetical protein
MAHFVQLGNPSPNFSPVFCYESTSRLLTLRRPAQSNPQRIINTFPVELLGLLASKRLEVSRDETGEKSGLAVPVILSIRLEDLVCQVFALKGH